MNKYFFTLLLILSIFGIIDAGYLTYSHFFNQSINCTYGSWQFIDCGTVVNSNFAYLMGIPIALLGLIHYILLFFWVIGIIFTKKQLFRIFAYGQSKIGFLFSLYLIYIQIFILNSICLFCMLSALISILIFIILFKFTPLIRKEFYIFVTSLIYRHLIKAILFKFDPETIHELMIQIGHNTSKYKIVRQIISFLYKEKFSSLNITIKKINFESPIGLSAGFDYTAELTQVLGPWGFGLQTIGTITNNPYNGNDKPRLMRLPKSKSILVNKGFKNPGADEVIAKLKSKQFLIPTGISIGKTNTLKIKTQQEAIIDIVTSFNKFEQSKLKFQYYELNISCPNLHGDIEFYSTPNLKELLRNIDKLKLTRPVFVKMPIDKTNLETLEMLKLISQHKITGVIFGNLQKDRSDSSFDKHEIALYENFKGNFSGKPTYDRSNELIKLAYKNFHKQLVIVGCGGVFSGQDAYQKIKNGATLVQLITGMIYNGPQLIMQINFELDKLLKQDGYTHISQAVGVESKH